MWKYTIKAYSQKPNYLLKAKLESTPFISTDDFHKKMNRMRGKLELVLPAKFKTKYSVESTGLLLVVRSKDQKESSRVAIQLEDLIKSAITSF